MAIGSISNGDSGSSCRSKINQGLTLWDGLVGAIIAYGGSSAPSKWALCNGAEVNRTTYSALFAIIGETFGAGNGTTTFNLPDLRGAVPAGVNGGYFTALGNLVGEENHVLSQSELPSINLTSTAIEVLQGSLTEEVQSGSGASNIPYNTSYSSITVPLGGSNAGHNNIQPSLCVNYIIYTGV